MREQAHCAQFFAPSAILSCAQCSSVWGISHWHAVLLTVFYVYGISLILCFVVNDVPCRVPQKAVFSCF